MFDLRRWQWREFFKDQRKVSIIEIILSAILIIYILVIENMCVCSHKKTINFLTRIAFSKINIKFLSHDYCRKDKVLLLLTFQTIIFEVQNNSNNGLKFVMFNLVKSYCYKVIKLKTVKRFISRTSIDNCLR